MQGLKKVKAHSARMTHPEIIINKIKLRTIEKSRRMTRHWVRVRTRMILLMK